MNLDFDLEIVNGIGKKTKSELNENGIYSILDLLYLFPKNYEIFEENPKLLRSEEYTVIKGDLDSNPVFLKHRTNSNAIIFYLNCYGNRIKCITKINTEFAATRRATYFVGWCVKFVIITYRKVKMWVQTPTSWLILHL